MTDSLPLRAALAVLITLQVLMLGSLFAGVAPHPPVAIKPFALAPFLSASIATTLAAVIMAERARAGSVLSGLAVLMALVSFGPHKYVDPAFALIWPAVIAAQVASAVIIYRVYLAFRVRAVPA